MNISRDAEVSSDNQALALGLVKLVDVVAAFRVGILAFSWLKDLTKRNFMPKWPRFGSGSLKGRFISPILFEALPARYCLLPRSPEFAATRSFLGKIMISLPHPISRIQRGVLVVATVCLLTSFASIIFVAARNESSANTAALTLAVINTNNDGPGSLREAILNANASVGLDTIVFNIPGSGPHVINPQTMLPEITDPVVIDGTTQPGYAGSPVIVLDGNGLSDASGLVIRAGGSTVRGLAIVRFGIGIVLRDGDNNVIQGNYLGIDPTGSALGNNTAINISSSKNFIGGITAATRNIISGNRFGISVAGNDNGIHGNFIGTNAAGTEAIPNAEWGVLLGSGLGTNNLVGGAAPGAGNLISGNQLGILIIGSGNTVQNNLIGTDVTGTKPIPNSTGIESRVPNTLIGGLAAGDRNVISGNIRGLVFGGTGSKLQGNFIGTDVTGTLPLSNVVGVEASDGALIGGTVPGARNVISGNAINGPNGNIMLPVNSSGGVTVQGNYIGTDLTGTRAIGPTTTGILIRSSNNVIGGTAPGAGNLISGNIIGIRVGGGSQNGVAGNIIQGNLIGLNALGTAPLPNRLHGIEVVASDENTIGGTQNGAANKIAFNGLTGVVITQGTGNSIRGNSLFSNAGLGIDLGGFATGTAGVTPNDPNDADNGSNNLQNFPVLTSITSVGNNTTIQGSLNSTPNTTFQIDFYTSAALDSSGNGEGAQFFNTTSVTTDGSGNATINASFPVALGTGRVVTATATDPSGNTSEFSAGDATAGAGNVQFSVRFMSVIEDVGLMTVTVVRTGGSAGTLTVDFATSDDTAIAGQDYTATSGTLTFNDGETSKTFQIPITDDVLTEPNETFTISLRNTPNLESLGIPNTLGVTILDRSIAPTFLIEHATVVEGGPGTTTQMLVPLNLSAATGRTASVSFATRDSLAVGGTTCAHGVDYITTSGTITFQPGTSAMSIPITICGDRIAETGEAFVITLSNPVNGQLFTTIGTGGITNDDVLELVLEESGPTVNQAAALDALLLVRDPFRIVGIPEWWPTTGDRNTRVILFANLELRSDELPSAIVIRIFVDDTSPFDVQAEAVRPIPNTDLTEVVFRLPNHLPLGTHTVRILAHTQISNAGTIRIVE